MEIRPHTEMYVRENSKTYSKDKNKNKKKPHQIFTINLDIFMNVTLNYNGVGNYHEDPLCSYSPIILCRVQEMLKAPPVGQKITYIVL